MLKCIILSLNYWGLTSLPKWLSLKRIVEYDHPEIIFLKETLGPNETIKKCLEGLLGGWYFICLDASGHSSSLVIGWSNKLIKLINSWRLIIGLFLKFFSEELGRHFYLLNVYGTNHNQIYF